MFWPKEEILSPGEKGGFITQPRRDFSGEKKKKKKEEKKQGKSGYSCPPGNVIDTPKRMRPDKLKLYRGNCALPGPRTYSSGAAAQENDDKKKKR